MQGLPGRPSRSDATTAPPPLRCRPLDALPADLLARLRERAGSGPGDVGVHGTHVGTYTDWSEEVALQEGAQPGSGAAFAAVTEHMRVSGWPMRPMHAFAMPDGSIRLSTDLPRRALAPPPGPAAWALVETATGRPAPGDLRDLYGIAGGGFGPGIGAGLVPLSGPWTTTRTPDDYWYDDGVAIVDDLSTVAADLASWLGAWLDG